MNQDLNARRENSGNERLSDKKYFKIVLAAGIIALTVFLMIFFKNNPDGIRKLVAEQGENIVSFYTNNLQPALMGSKLTVSDVFNFAVNDNLPIDKDNNTCLYVGSASNGAEMLEVRALDKAQMVDYNRFKEEAGLNKEQERKLDSILNSYRPQIEKLILANEDNTIAVNANMWNLNKYILVDVIRFLKQERKETFLKTVMPHGISSSELETQFAQIKNINPDDYVFIAPDTVFPMKFKYEYSFDDHDIVHEHARSQEERSRALEAAVAKIHENSGRLNKQMNHDFMTSINASDNIAEAVRIQFDSSLIPPDRPEIPDNFSFKIEAIKDKLKHMSMKFGPNMMEITEDRLKMNFYSDEGDSASAFHLDIDLSGLGGLTEEMTELADSLSAMNLQIDGYTKDSIKNSSRKQKDKIKTNSKSRSH